VEAMACDDWSHSVGRSHHRRGCLLFVAVEHVARWLMLRHRIDSAELVQKDPISPLRNAIM
jgi:hypothetical protein